MGPGMIMRGATIPFATDEKEVASLVPMMWYQGDTVDAGLQARYEIFGPTYLDFELMTDFEGNAFANLRYGSSWQSRRFQFHPYAEFKLKNRQYNSYYYGLDLTRVAGGCDLAVGFIGTFHFISNLYAYGAAKFTLLDRQVRKSEFVNKDATSEIFLGLGLSNDRDKPLKPKLGSTAFWRVAHGWATPSSLADIFHGQAAKDVYNNQMTSVFFGQPLTNSLFGLPLDLYANLGAVWHWKSAVQGHAQEGVANIKLFYTIPLPVRLRLGAAEGVSYVNTIPYVEETQLSKKGYKPSKLLNYLGFSAGINLGDITDGESLRHWWLGFSIHHRSAIFENVQHFGRIKGGSNFQTAYLQWHY